MARGRPRGAAPGEHDHGEHRDQYRQQTPYGQPPPTPRQFAAAGLTAGMKPFAVQCLPDQLRRPLSALAAENLAALLAAMLIVAPVAGLRPCRAAR
jgi:hypothetical protein